MDTKTFIKTGGTLAGLSFIATVVAALLLAFSIMSKGMTVVCGIILLLLGVVFIFLTFFKSDAKSPRGVYGFVGFFAIISGFMWFFIGETFNTKDAYLNKLVIYLIFLIGFMGAVSCFWGFVTRKVFGPLLTSTSFDEKQETLLYLAINILYALLLALVCAAPKSTKTTSLCAGAIVNSIGIWFLNALIGLAVGYVLTTKAGSAGPASMAAPIASGSDYDGIN